MTAPDLFFNRAGRLRSGWRFCVFVAAFLVALLALGPLLLFGLALALPADAYDWLLESRWGFVLQHFLLLPPAVLLGWACGHALEDLPWRALGWTLHRGWARDLALGLALGAASNLLALALASAGGGVTFTFPAAALWPSVAQTLASSGLIFLLGAASEEALFRGYPLQTLMRSWPVWLALLPTSLPFALVHLANPNVVPGFTTVNTALAGAWLAVAYARTRSMWFPLGLHWSWNWVMGALLGVPVSGITQLTPDPLLRATAHGPAWLTGGAYGFEGGAACTVALVLSIIFLRRTRLLKADPELKRLTDEENPAAGAAPISITQA